MVHNVATAHTNVAISLYEVENIHRLALLKSACAAVPYEYWT